MRKNWVVFNCIDDEFELVETEEQAKSEVKETLKYYADKAHVARLPKIRVPDGIERSIGYAKIVMSTKIT